MQATRKIPRASFSITMLDDEDFRILMSDKCGTSGLGVFLALCLVGRRRLLDKRARRIGNSDALVIDNSLDHTLDLARVRRKEFDAFLDTMQRIATQTGSQPWVYVDADGHIVIRSFFKFNADANHGGPRDGAGRESRRNQDDSSGNQDDSSATKGGASVSVSSSLSVSSPSLDSARERESAAQQKPEKPRPKSAPTLVADDDPIPEAGPVIRPPDPSRPPLNTDAEVQALVAFANEQYPCSNIAGWAQTWAMTHEAAFVRECILKAVDAEASSPSHYIGKLLRNGPQPAAPPKLRIQRPEPERLEHRIHRAPRPTGTAS